MCTKSVRYCAHICYTRYLLFCSQYVVMNKVEFPFRRAFHMHFGFDVKLTTRHFRARAKVIGLYELAINTKMMVARKNGSKKVSFPQNFICEIRE